MNNRNFRRSYFSIGASLVATLSLSACMSIGYRCPLNSTDNADEPTACKNMQDAIAGAKKGSGGRTSVFLDDQGRIIPRELLEQRTASPLLAQGTPDPHYPATGQPAFQQPKVFQVWSSSFVDSEGNLHDGHNAWFTTPGRWTRGSMDTPTSTGENIMSPSLPTERPKGRVVTVDPRTGREAVPQTQPQAQAKRESDASALQALAQAANSSAAKASTAKQAQPPAKPQGTGVTTPAIQLND